MPETALDASSASELETPAAGAVTDAAGVSSDANPAGSSAADEGAKAQPKTLLDVVQNVVKEGPKDGEASPTSENQAGKPEASTDGKKPEDAPKDEDANVPFHKHPAWQRRVARERELVKTNDELTKQVSQLNRDAEQFHVIERFREANGISVDEVVAGFKTIALIKTDPVKALPELRKIVGQIELAIGEQLPADLQEQVDNGAITEAAAKETARLRASNKALTSRVETVTAREGERAVADTREAIRSEVSKWEQSVKASDPDWQEKLEMVQDKVFAIVQRTGRAPATPEDALALAKEAYVEVGKTFARLRPKPTATRSHPASGSSATDAKAAPKSLLEAARQGLAA